MAASLLCASSLTGLFGLKPDFKEGFLQFDGHWRSGYCALCVGGFSVWEVHLVNNKLYSSS